MQVGFGDQRFVEDAEVRAPSVGRSEPKRCGSRRAGAAGRGAAGYAQRESHRSCSRRMRPTPARGGVRRSRGAGREASRPSSRQRSTPRSPRWPSTASTLEGLDSEGRLVVGQVAMRNFGLVRDRLKNIVLRADVGVTEEAGRSAKSSSPACATFSSSAAFRAAAQRGAARGARRHGRDREALRQPAGEPKVTDAKQD